MGLECGFDVKQGRSCGRVIVWQVLSLSYPVFSPSISSAVICMRHQSP